MDDRPDLMKLSRRERRKQEVHGRILDAAVELFESNGFEGTTVDRICERADVAQKTFFNHFPTKQHLIRELAHGIVDEFHAQIEAARKLEGTTAERIDHFFERSRENVHNFARVSRELVLEVISVSHIDPEETRKVHAEFAALLSDGVVRGEVTDRYSVEFLAEMAIGLFHDIMLNWVSLDDYPVEDRLREAADFVAHAVRIGLPD